MQDRSKKLPKKIFIPGHEKFSYPTKIKSHYISHIESRYANNPGELESFNYPINRMEFVGKVDTTSLRNDGTTAYTSYDSKKGQMKL